MSPRSSTTVEGESPELRLLLEMVRAWPHILDANSLGEFVREVDWSAFERLASRHHLVPLLFSQLRQPSSCPAPREFMARLWRSAQQISRQGESLAIELVRVLEYFGAQGIRLIPLKGPVLEQQVYGKSGLREFRDLDLLVSVGDVARATASLAALGYVRVHQLGPGGDDQLVRDRRVNQILLYCEERDATLELHWRTDPEFAVEPEADPEWWNSRPRIHFRGCDVPVLDADETFLALCLHGMKHFWESLHWLVDLAALARAREPDWTWLQARASTMRAELRLAVSLLLLEELLRVGIPSSTLEWARTRPRAVYLCRRLRAAIFGAPERFENAFWRCSINLVLYEDFASRLRFLNATLFAPSIAERSRWHLKQEWRFLYPLLRMYRLTAKHFRKGLGRNV